MFDQGSRHELDTAYWSFKPMKPFSHGDNVLIFDDDSIGQEDQYNFRKAGLMVKRSRVKLPK